MNEVVKYLLFDILFFIIEKRCYFVVVDWEGVCDYLFDYVLINLEISFVCCGLLGMFYVS